jgi:hypothetical protein
LLGFTILPDGWVFHSHQETSIILPPVYLSLELLRDLAFSIAAEDPVTEPSNAGREFFSQNTDYGITPSNVSYTGMVSRALLTVPAGSINKLQLSPQFP